MARTCADSVTTRVAAIIIRCPGAIIGIFLFICVCSLIPLFIPDIMGFDGGLGAFEVSHEIMSDRALAYKHLIGEYKDPSETEDDRRRRLSPHHLDKIVSKTEVLRVLSNIHRTSQATREHRALKSQTLPLIGAKNEDFWRLMFRDEESISYCTKQSDCPDDFYCGLSQKCYPCIDPLSGLTCTFFADADCSTSCPTVANCEVFNLNWTVPKCDPTGLSQECGSKETCRRLPSPAKLVPRTYNGRCGRCSTFEPPLVRLRPPLCPATCLNNLTCDQALLKAHGVSNSKPLSCERLEADHACNCHGCACHSRDQKCKSVSQHTNNHTTRSPWHPKPDICKKHKCKSGCLSLDPSPKCRLKSSLFRAPQIPSETEWDYSAPRYCGKAIGCSSHG